MGGAALLWDNVVDPGVRHVGGHMDLGPVVAGQHQYMVHHMAVFAAAALAGAAGSVCGGGGSSALLPENAAAGKRYIEAAGGGLIPTGNEPSGCQQTFGG